MVILHERPMQTGGLPPLTLIETFHKKAALVTKDVRLDNQHLRYAGWQYLHRDSPPMIYPIRAVAHRCQPLGIREIPLNCKLHARLKINRRLPAKFVSYP